MAQFQLTERQAGGGSSGHDFAVIPDETIVDVEVVKVELRDKPAWAIKDPERTQEVSFRFKVTSGEHKGRTLWGNVPPYYNTDPRCRLRLWTNAILGFEVTPKDFTLDLDDLAGRKARVLVGNYTNRKGETKDTVRDVFTAHRFVDFEQEQPEQSGMVTAPPLAAAPSLGSVVGQSPTSITVPGEEPW